MMHTNYFKVRTAAGHRLFWFDHRDRESTRRAFGQATSLPGVVSVFSPVPISGEWDTVPAIMAEPVEMLRPLRKASVRLGMFGEAGVW
jgi:hypothetical protein